MPGKFLKDPWGRLGTALELFLSDIADTTHPEQTVHGHLSSATSFISAASNNSSKFGPGSGNGIK